MNHMAEPRSSPLRTQRTALLPLALVLVSLLSLALLPMITMRSTQELRKRIAKVAEPSRSLVIQVQNALALESASARAYLLTGDRSSMEDRARAAADRERALLRLVPLARRLGPDASARLDELVAGVRPLGALYDSLFTGRLPREKYLASIELQQQRLQNSLAAAAGVDRAIARESAANLAKLQTTERISAAIAVALVLLAIVAALLVANLGTQYRRLAMTLARWSRQQDASIRIANRLDDATTAEEVVHAIENDAVQASAEVLGSDCEVRFQGPEHPAHSATERRLVVPVSANGSKLGELIFERPGHRPQFGEIELAYAGALRELTMAAVRRVTLLEELRESEERFRQIADAIHDVVWLTDAGFTRTLFVNAAYERVWGLPRKAVVNPEALLDGVHPDDRERVRAAQPRGQFDVEFRVVRPDGQVRWVWARGFPVRNERGEIYRIAGITEDITERKLAAESRTRLIRGFTHDVKNPLGAADGFLALLEEEVAGELNAKQKDSVERSRRSIRNALSLIHNLLEIERAEAGQLDVDKRPVDVAGVARDVTEEFRAEAETRNLALSVNVADKESDNGLLVETDHARVRQILANLLSNAVKYTQPGGRITVQAGPRSDGDAPGKGDWVTVDVTDTGTGIPPDKQALLFQEFTRFDPEAAEGAGIGLAISQRVAKALDATITVKSKPDVGSTFTLWLPRSMTAARRRRDPARR